MPDSNKSLHDITANEDLIRYLKLGKSPEAFGDQLVGFFDLVSISCVAATWEKFLGEGNGSGPRESKFYQYCEAISILTGQIHPYYQFCSRDKAAEVYRLTDGAMVDVCGKFWTSKKDVVEEFLSKFRPQFPGGFDFKWDLYPEDEVLAELQQKYPKEYPRSSVEVESIDSPPTEIGAIVDPSLDEPDQFETPDEKVVVTQEPVEEVSIARSLRKWLPPVSTALAIIALCIAVAATVSLIDKNNKRTASVEKINLLNVDAYETQKVDAASKWTMDELQRLAKDIDLIGLEETNRRLTQIESYLYWIRKYEEDPTCRDKALAGLPNSSTCVYPEILLMRGQLLFEKVDGVNALKEFDAALELAIDTRLETQLLIGRASSLDVIGNHDAAIREIDLVVPKIRTLANNRILMRKALLIRSRAYIARGGKGDVDPAFDDISFVLNGVEEAELLKVTTPLPLTVLGNDLYALAQEHDRVAVVEKLSDVEALRESISSRVLEFGNAGKQSVLEIRFQQFLEAVNQNLADELKFGWELSIEQYRVAKDIVESPNLAKFVSDKEIAKFKSNDVVVAAKLSEETLAATHAKLVGFRKLIATTPMNAVEKSVYSLMALETAFSIFRFELKSEDYGDFDFAVFANGMLNHLKDIKSLPLKHRQRIKDFSGHINLMIDDASAEHEGFKPAVNFKARFDNHNFQFEKTILD